MTKRRGRLSDEELAHYENDIASSSGIMQSMIRLWHMLPWISDDDVRPAAEEEVKGTFRRANSIRKRNQASLEEIRRRKRNK